MAGWFLQEHGAEVIRRNIRVDDGEIDLLIRDGAQVAAVEVRTVTAHTDPIDAVDRTKRLHVGGLARRLGADRADFVGVRLGEKCVDFHWVCS